MRKLKSELEKIGYSEKTVKEILKWYKMNEIIGLSKISGKAQITIPKDVMKELKLKSNDKILWIKENDKIIVKKA